jgi:hypothetical protein
MCIFNIKIWIRVRNHNQFFDFFSLIYKFCVCVYIMVDFELSLTFLTLSLYILNV